jgi:hypothetical protein
MLAPPSGHASIWSRAFSHFLGHVGVARGGWVNGEDPLRVVGAAVGAAGSVRVFTVTEKVRILIDGYRVWSRLGHVEGHPSGSCS